MLQQFFLSLMLLTFSFNPNFANDFQDIPRELISIKGKQIGKLVGLNVREKNRDLVSRERKILETVEKWFERTLQYEESILKLMLVSFTVGLLTSFTPCIYPLIPVSAGILASGPGRGLIHHIGRAVVYVLGIASVHAGLGYTAATTGMIFGQWLANIYVVMLLILFLLFLAFSLFGFYDINFRFGSAEVPRNRSLFATYFYGLVVGVASSPCLSPVLAILLAYVGSLAQPFYGFLMLFSFSLGVNMLLVIVGSFSGILSALPRPGAWMIEIKKLLGFMMFFGCLYFAAPFLERYHILFFGGLIFLVAFIYYAYSANNERILYVLQKHTDEDRNSVFDTFSIRSVLKFFISIITLVLGCYLCYTAFLVYKKTTTVKLLTKLLLN